MYVVTVLLTIHPSDRGTFETLILKNATLSLKETGCTCFDVCFSEDGNQCFLYELYKDRAAFDDHLATAHFKEFNELTQSLVITKRVEIYSLLSNPNV
ncbi:MAG: antibiotic biosynthesis monooxygenase [Acidobacteria bacterium]|nr:antibiotic biosynthesis monooxygenase [Acidobacteriota bacterium]MCI0724462.1 antibiotic biosynthesis monooxygenase [Acidobacteriota bacterium]